MVRYGPARSRDPAPTDLARGGRGVRGLAASLLGALGEALLARVLLGRVASLFLFGGARSLRSGFGRRLLGGQLRRPRGGVRLEVALLVLVSRPTVTWVVSA